MQILKISLYGKNGERRDVDFELGKVNIITGASKRGKTSLIDITEYCLGASECSVAEGHIRQTVDWYSILLQFPDCQVFIARAAPLQGAKANAIAHMLVEKVVRVPNKSELSNSTNISSVVSYLTRKLGVPEQVTEVPEGQTRPEVKVNFRHSRYYLFQSQNEIANNDILFHQQAKPHIPQNIKDTLPYFIGAADDGRLSEIKALRLLKRKRSQLAKQIKEIESLKGEGLQKGYVLLIEAVELDLYDSVDLIPGDEKLIEILGNISQWSPFEKPNESSNDPVASLEEELQVLQRQKNSLKIRLRQAQEYSTSESGYEGVVHEQEYRLKSIGLFRKFGQSLECCPVCDAPHKGSTRFEEVITGAIEDLSRKLEGVGRSKPRVSAYVNKLKDEQANVGVQLKRTRVAMNKLTERDNELADHVKLNNLRARLSGKIELYLDSIDWNNDSNSMVTQIELLEQEIHDMSERLDPEALKEKLNAQLNCISDDMTLWAKELKLEHSENRVRLDAINLSVVVDTPHGVISLGIMGSGENWVGYHLITYFALAKWFIEQSRPVGRFLFLDQPSQVYFPAETSVTGDVSEIGSDEDRQSLKDMYKWIFKVVESLFPDFQVIITDHADIDEEWFQSAIRDDKWRGDSALIPKSWYEASP